MSNKQKANRGRQPLGQKIQNENTETESEREIDRTQKIDLKSSFQFVLCCLVFERFSLSRKGCGARCVSFVQIFFSQCENKREKLGIGKERNKNGCDPLKDYFILCTKMSWKNWKRMLRMRHWTSTLSTLTSNRIIAGLNVVSHIYNNFRSHTHSGPLT